MSSGNACEGKTTTTNPWGSAGSMGSLRSCLPYIGSLYVSWIVGRMEGMIRGGGGAVKWSLGRGALDSEACKHWPCLRQKSSISLPCIRQETSFNNPDSFHFWPQISDNVTSNVARISGRGLQITLPVFLPSSSLGWKSWLESWLSI